MYDGLRMTLDGAYQYQLACLRHETKAAETRPPVVSEREIATALSDRRELSAKDLAAIWGVSPRSIYAWKTTGGLPYKKVGRLLRFDWIKADLWSKRHQESFTRARLRVVK